MKSIKEIAEEFIKNEAVNRLDSYFVLHFAGHLDSKYELVEKKDCAHEWVVSLVEDECSNCKDVRQRETTNKFEEIELPKEIDEKYSLGWSLHTKSINAIIRYLRKLNSL